MPTRNDTSRTEGCGYRRIEQYPLNKKHHTFVSFIRVVILYNKSFNQERTAVLPVILPQAVLCEPYFSSSMIYIIFKETPGQEGRPQMS